MVVVKKYSNRRLYDTGDSRYITLEDLAQKVRGGADVRVVDAGSGEDLTQATLTQIIIESRGAARLLPVPLLLRLIRMGDDALAEFFGRFVSWALEAYIQLRQGAQAAAPYNPFAALPFSASNAFARLLSQLPWEAPGSMPGWVEAAEPTAPYRGGADEAYEARRAAAEAARRAAPDPDEFASLRREVEDLKRAVKNQRRTKKK